MSDPRDADAALLATSGRRAQATELARVRRGPVDPIQAAMGCPPPIWLNQPGAKEPDGRCVLFSGPNRCPHPATHRVWIGCTVGEHLDKSDVCARHAHDVPNTLPQLNCGRCWDALGQVVKAQVIKVEAINDDDDDQAAPGASPDLVP